MKLRQLVQQVVDSKAIPPTKAARHVRSHASRTYLDGRGLAPALAPRAARSATAAPASPEPTTTLGAPYQDVAFIATDDIEIHGWYVPSKNGAAVILPGRTTLQPHAGMLVEHGYGVLLYDRRGEGASEGDPNMLGWGGSRDVHGAVEFLEGRSDVDPGSAGWVSRSPA